MRELNALVKRNTALFFKDKGTLFSALIAPLIILGLYIMFLGNVFRESFQNAIPETVSVPDSLINGYVAGWEVSSILAVCCVSVAFIANLISVQDKITGAVHDLSMTPVSREKLSLGYYISTAIVTLTICLLSLAAGLVYISMCGWYVSVAEILLLVLDIIILSMFGTALSSIVSSFLSSQGGMSAVSTIVSSVYGFICGAYYPISQFSESIKNIVICLPGTYGTALMRNHFLSGVFRELKNTCGFPDDVIEKMKDGFDVNLYFFNNKVSIGTMYAVLLISIAVCVTIFIAITLLRERKHKSDR